MNNNYVDYTRIVLVRLWYKCAKLLALLLSWERSSTLT